MNVKRFSGKFFILLSIFIVFFLVTLIFITFDADRRLERVLFFPDEDGQQLLGELRRLPVRDELAGNIELFIDELILGPGEIDLYRLFPEEVKLESLLLDGNTLYLGFTENLVTMAETVPLGLNGIITAVADAVVFNFPEVKEVKTAIGGEPVAESVSDVEKK
ncbi:MAG: GerMN domain-containing protein [Spirochaetales bacterium]|nr:GerMN domain-containing protein [Spirochaetales bacterium]